MMTGTMWHLRRPAVLILALALFGLAACSVDEALIAPECDGGSGLIAAQSVPSAQLLPCFDSLPDGWSYATVHIDQNGTKVRLDSDRAGESAAVLSFDEQCDIGDAVAVPSNFDGADRFDAIERVQPGFRSRIYYRFDGGCVSWEFDFDSGTSATESIALEESLSLLTRESVNEGLRESFIDEEL
ncbi:MAG: hypothetical protein IH940_09490 [Acidobacteria bacterium]|nr:hypothetical protein [Acidobacteriota bacterium]